MLKNVTVAIFHIMKGKGKLKVVHMTCTPYLPYIFSHLKPYPYHKFSLKETVNLNILIIYVIWHH